MTQYGYGYVAGMYHHTIAPAAPYGLPLSAKTLPQYLQGSSVTRIESPNCLLNHAPLGHKLNMEKEEKANVVVFIGFHVFRVK